MSNKDAEMKEEIVMQLRKKDYYDILGISKSADDTQIKKAYKRLALRFHPDKNPTEGAKDVFKKVSNAYRTLIDAGTRETYNRFGSDEDRERMQQQQRQAYANANRQDYEYDTADQFFRQFFAEPTSDRHYRRFNFTMGDNSGQQTSLIYVIIAVFAIYALAPLLEQKSNFSLKYQGEYTYRHKTSILSFEYYSNERYLAQIRNPMYKRQVEGIIDNEHIKKLIERCNLGKRERQRLENYAYQSKGAKREQLLAQAKAIDISSCHLLNHIRTENQQYLRKISSY